MELELELVERISAQLVKFITSLEALQARGWSRRAAAARSVRDTERRATRPGLTVALEALDQVDGTEAAQGTRPRTDQSVRRAAQVRRRSEIQDVGYVPDVVPRILG